MSNVLQLNVKPGKLNFKIKNSSFEEKDDAIAQENSFEKQLQQNYENGFSDGQNAIRKELEANHERRLFEHKQMLQSVVASLNEKLVDYDQQFEAMVVNLSFLISEKIIKREIETKTIIDETLKDALKKVLGANKVIIKLNKTDLEHIRKNSQGIFNDDIFSKITFESEERIESGGCLVETEIGNVESRIALQISELKKQLEHHLFTQNN
ncbi:MAG: FliH/SctL family protein [Ignavibacteriaceae bacterium]|nr:FliH/SctL family protein [Ignavibacteriaceae bacterium]